MLCALIACLAALLCVLVLLVPGPHYAARANPFYWLLLLPFAWWANGVAAYEAGPLRTLRPALALAIVVALASIAAAVALGLDPAPWIIAASITILFAAASQIVYRGSLLAREGPAR